MTSGMAEAVVAETQISQVDGQAGRLIVRGRSLDDLAGLDFEAMAHWLCPAAIDGAANGDAQQALAEARLRCYQQLPTLLAACDPRLSAIEALVQLLAGLRDGRNDAIAIAGAMPVCLAGYWRKQQGLTLPPPNLQLGQVADFLTMLEGAPPTQARIKALSRYLVTVAEHGMNASTFAVRVVASTEAGLQAAVIAGLCALQGPLHGGAPGPVLDMLDEIGEQAQIQPWIDRQIKMGSRIMGFGHRIYRVRDPRADILKLALSEYTEQFSYSQSPARRRFAEHVEAAVKNALALHKPDRRLDTNVEYYTALLLEAIGLQRQLFSALFAMGRVLGWLAHADEQIREGRLMRPKSLYVGPLPEQTTAQPSPDRRAAG